jgi:hypothetical protein
MNTAVEMYPYYDFFKSQREFQDMKSETFFRYCREILNRKETVVDTPTPKKNEITATRLIDPSYDTIIHNMIDDEDIPDLASNFV